MTEEHDERGGEREREPESTKGTANEVMEGRGKTKVGSERNKWRSEGSNRERERRRTGARTRDTCKVAKEMERHEFLPSERQHGIISEALKLEQREQM